MWEITVWETSVEMQVTGNRMVAIKMEKSRGSQKRGVKFTGLHMYWVGFDGGR